MTEISASFSVAFFFYQFMQKCPGYGLSSRKRDGTEQEVVGVRAGAPVTGKIRYRALSQITVSCAGSKAAR